MAKKKDLQFVETEMTYRELVNAFLTLRPLVSERLPVKTALKVRRIHRDLEPEIRLRDETHQKILTDNGAEKEGDGWKIDEDGNAVFATKKGKAAAEKQLAELGDTTVTIKIVPLTFDEMEANGLAIQPALLLALEDTHLLVD